jgi:hypothetical protein
MNLDYAVPKVLADLGEAKLRALLRGDGRHLEKLIRQTAKQELRRNVHPDDQLATALSHQDRTADEAASLLWAKLPQPEKDLLLQIVARIDPASAGPVESVLELDVPYPTEM